ncbi:putative caspase, interleukin-1 beta converting enzyme (ICE) homologues [Trypoxylus dichotomus]
MEADGNCFSSRYGREESFDEEDALKQAALPQANIVAYMSTQRNARYYKMDHKKRGLAIIFNHEFFEVPGLKQRMYTQVDCRNLKLQLERLHFDVVVYNNLDHEDMHGKIIEASKVDYKNYDCFLLAVLSHGNKGILFARDDGYEAEILWERFTADNVPTLAGKPKIFFIQACQYDQVDAGITISRTETDSSPHYYRIPIHADFVIAYSTVSGSLSWRSVNRGSWFIEALCSELETNGFNEDLLTILTFVCRRVGLEYESNIPSLQYMRAQTQMPFITSMLTRLIKFTKRQ